MKHPNRDQNDRAPVVGTYVLNLQPQSLAGQDGSALPKPEISSGPVYTPACELDPELIHRVSSVRS